MQLNRHLVFLPVLLLILSCTSATKKDYIPEPGGEYVTASWYGPKFNGRPTASGERFDMHGLTAAHKYLPFGTELRVTNPDNGRSVNVKVNDRGPFIRGRDLDLSYGAARAIGMDKKGVGRVKIEYLGRDMRYVKRIAYRTDAKIVSRGLLTIQVGSFEDKENAMRLKKGLEFAYNDVTVSSALVRGKTFYRVRVGMFKNRSSAVEVAEKLADEGYAIFIKTKE
jgi:rare lipoprotein A